MNCLFPNKCTIHASCASESRRLYGFGLMMVVYGLLILSQLFGSSNGEFKPADYNVDYFPKNLSTNAGSGLGCRCHIDVLQDDVIYHFRTDSDPVCYDSEEMLGSWSRMTILPHDSEEVAINLLHTVDGAKSRIHPGPAFSRPHCGG